MITDEQMYAACAAYGSSEVAHSQLAAMRKALEAYEQSKPTPEPVGEVYSDTDRLTGRKCLKAIIYDGVSMHDGARLYACCKLYHKE